MQTVLDGPLPPQDDAARDLAEALKRRELVEQQVAKLREAQREQQSPAPKPAISNWIQWLMHSLGTDLDPAFVYAMEETNMTPVYVPSIVVSSSVSLRVAVHGMTRSRGLTRRCA